MLTDIKCSHCLFFSLSVLHMKKRFKGDEEVGANVVCDNAKHTTAGVAHKNKEACGFKHSLNSANEVKAV